MLLSTLLLACGLDQVWANVQVVETHSMDEIGRLATAINAAHCPSLLNSAPTFRLQPSRRRARHFAETHLLLSSNDPEQVQDESEQLDMSWYISHTPSTETVTLAITSLPEPLDLAEYFLDTNMEQLDLEPISPYMDIGNSTAEPHVHISHLYALEEHGLPAMIALLDVLREMSDPEDHVSKVEIVGHGLGASTALLLTLALPDMDTDLEIRTTLFGLPLIGDQAFADWVEDQQHATKTIRKVTSYRDAILRLPPHNGLVQPKLDEVWITSDPRVAHDCGKGGCHVHLRGSFSDHLGPYGGVWIGSETC